MNASDRLRASIKEDFGAIAGSLHTILTPPGHRWEFWESELTWFDHDVLASTRHGASIYLRRSPPDEADVQQLYIEVRVFWNENEKRPRRSGMRAALWVERGERFDFRAKSLLSPGPLFIHADDRDALLRDIHHQLEAALTVYQTDCCP